MKLEDILTSLEPSQKLKELGIKQEGLFYWVDGSISYDCEGGAEIENDGKWSIWKEFREPQGCDFKTEPFKVFLEKEHDDITEEDIKNIDAAVDARKKKTCRAYTAAELGVLLPKHFYCDDRRYAIQYGWDGDEMRIRLEEWLPGRRDDIEIFTDKNEANIRAKMLIYLIKNNLIKL